MLCGLKGNRTSGVALAMHHGLSSLFTRGLNGRGNGDEHRPISLVGYGTL